MIFLLLLEFMSILKNIYWKIFSNHNYSDKNDDNDYNDDDDLKFDDIDVLIYCFMLFFNI